MKTTFYLFRHGETDWNKMRKIQGHSDIPLNDTGKEQAKTLFPRLKESGLQKIYSSDLIRAKETASILASELGVEIEHLSDLREAHLGVAEGMLVEDVVEKYGENFWSKFRNDDPEALSMRFPEGESRLESRMRVLKVLNNIVEKGVEKVVGISTHGGVLRSTLHSFLDDDAAPLDIPNCVIYKLTHENKKWSVEGPL